MAYLLSSPNAVLESVRKAVEAYQAKHNTSLADSLINLYGTVSKLIQPARSIQTIIERVTRDCTFLLSVDEQASIVMFFNTVREFDEALAEVDVNVIDIYQPGIIQWLVEVTGGDLDVHRFFNNKIAPQYNLDPANLPPSLAHFLANYSGDFGYWSEHQIGNMKADILGGPSFEWHRHDWDPDTKIPDFALRNSVAVPEENLHRLLQLCDSLIGVRTLLAETIRGNWTLAELADARKLSMEVIMGNQVNISNVTGSVINVDSILENVSQNISAISRCDSNDKGSLQLLVNKLKDLLKSVPDENKSDAEKIANRVDTAIKEVAKDVPDKELVEFSLNGLKKAASNIAAIIPSILPIATQIVAHIQKLL